VDEIDERLRAARFSLQTHYLAIAQADDAEPIAPHSALAE